MISAIFKGTVYTIQYSKEYVHMSPKYSLKRVIRLETQIFRTLYNREIIVLADNGTKINVNDRA